MQRDHTVSQFIELHMFEKVVKEMLFIGKRRGFCPTGVTGGEARGGGRRV